MLRRIARLQPVFKSYSSSIPPSQSSVPQNTTQTANITKNASAPSPPQQQEAQQILKDYGINSAKFAAFGLKKRYDEDADLHRTVPVTPEVIKLGYSMAWKALMWATIINLSAAIFAIYYFVVVWKCKTVEDIRIKLKQIINNMGLETLSDREEYNEQQMQQLEVEDPTRKQKVDKVKHFFKSIHIMEKEEEDKQQE